MTRILVLTATELTRDPRARRQVAAGQAAGLEMLGLSGQASGDPPARLDGVSVRRVGRATERSLGAHARLGEELRQGALRREARGLYRLARLLLRTIALLRAARGLPRPEVVHANDLDTLPAAWLLARRSEARLVYDAHELYSQFEADPPRVSRRLLLLLERRLAAAADAVVTVSEALAAELEKTLRLRERPLVVLNCPPRLTLSDSSGGATGPLRVVYQGSLGPGRELDDLLSACASVENVELTLRLVRFDTQLLRDVVASAGFEDRVLIAEPVAPDAVAHALEGWDVGVVIDRPVTRNAELAFPNKLFEYLTAGLAVVSSRLPALAELVEREQIGLTYEPGSAKGLADALAALSRERGRLEAMKARARAISSERFNAETQAQTLLTAWGVG